MEEENFQNWQEKEREMTERGSGSAMGKAA